MKIAFNLDRENCEVDIYIAEKALTKQIKDLNEEFPKRKNVTEDLSDFMATVLYKAMEKVCKVAEIELADLKPGKFVIWKHQSEVPIHIRQINL